MKTATFDTPSLSCTSCMVKVEDAVTPVPGVETVDVDIVTKRVRVTFDADTISQDDIAGILVETGYDVAAIAVEGASA